MYSQFMMHGQRNIKFLVCMDVDVRTLSNASVNISSTGF